MIYRVIWCVEYSDVGENFVFVFNGFKDIVSIGLFNIDVCFIGVVVEWQWVVGYFDFGFGCDIVGVFELFYILYVVLVQVGKDNCVDFVWMYIQFLFQMFMYLQVIMFFIFVVVFGCVFFVRQVGVDQDFVFIGVYIVVVNWVLVFFICRVFLENIGFKVSFELVSIDWVDFCFLYVYDRYFFVIDFVLYIKILFCIWL